jgi:hypothetical protein
MGTGPGSSEEVWQRCTNVGCNAHVHRSNACNLSA